MIRMEQPSFCFNSHDVGEPHYKMWRTIVGSEGMTAAELAGAILAAHVTAMRETGCGLKNIIINTHGYSGGLWIGGLFRTQVNKRELAAFGILKPWNVGTIWIVSCAAAKDGLGQNFCQSLANVAGAQVISSDADQVVTNWQGIKLFLACRWNIDDFEGTVYSFTPAGGMRKGIDPIRDVWTVREKRF